MLNFKYSQKGYEQTKLEEEKRNVAYLDPVGIWTIGYGHTGPEVVEGLVWTDEQCDEALKRDLGMI